MTAAEVARRLGGYRSNLSAMDAGRRLPSLRLVVRLSRVLGCGPGDLVEAGPASQTPVWRRADLNRRLQERDLGAVDGVEKGWVHAAQRAWRAHFGPRRSA